MKPVYLLLITLAGLSTGVATAEAPAVSELLHAYKLQGATTPDARAGRQLWHKTFSGKGRFAERSCSSCHGDDLRQTGRHVKTNKLIKPMAPSVNPERLSKSRDISKWFKRNCKWTLGRECTAAEKANLLAYIRQQ